MVFLMTPMGLWLVTSFIPATLGVPAKQCQYLPIGLAAPEVGSEEPFEGIPFVINKPVYSIYGICIYIYIYHI